MTASSIELLTQRATRWVADDPDEDTAEALRHILFEGDLERLRACFEPPLEFGTAGLRGVVGPGPAQMNGAVIRKVTKALAEVVACRCPASPDAPVVVGFDGRLDSRRFAGIAVGVLAAHGRSVAFFSEPVPTPVVAFAGLKLGAVASVVVTASHNPPQYNGYKVYGVEGVQIVPPFDREVADRLDGIGAARDVPCDGDAFTGGGASSLRLGVELVDEYVEAVVGARVPGAEAAPLRVAYTPLHGVGARTFRRVLRRAGYDEVHVESSQEEIDGRFPTVQFPNPEEAATLGRGILLAERIAADLLLVNDPDADRMGAALPDGTGRFRILTGNEIGILLTDYLLSHVPCPEKALVVSTIVSTPMTACLVRERGAHFEQTLTGFKWLWTAVMALEAEQGYQFTLCWEEALGYSTHRAVRDKDGIAASLVMADWVSDCKRKGIRPIDYLGSLYRRHGAWASAPRSLVRESADGVGEIGRMVRRLAERPPESLLGCKVVGLRDYSRGAHERPFYCGAAAMSILELERDARIVVRPSGTEPKLKFYADVREEVQPQEDPFEAYERAKMRAEHLTEALVAFMTQAGTA